MNQSSDAKNGKNFNKTSEIAWVPFDLMEKFAVDVFKAVGVPEEDARICTDVLIEADRKGIDSHGVGRLKSIYYDRIKQGIICPVTKVEVIRDKGAIAVLDGHNGMGQVISVKAMEHAIRKAEMFGIGMTAVRNSNHYGIAGYYAEMAVRKNMIGITGTNARPSVAPTFGTEPMLGTNPLTFAIPTDEEFPFLLDCATSTAQRGKIELYDREDKPIPPGWVIDSQGNVRTDTHQILDDLLKGRCSLTPLGGPGEEGAGYKGYGYATVVEILSAALSQGPFLKALSGIEDGKKVPYRLGHFFIAIDVSFFTEVENFKKTAGDICRALRSSIKAPGATRIYTAGEKEFIIYNERKNKGVPLTKALQQQIISIRDAEKLSSYRFPFE